MIPTAPPLQALHSYAQVVQFAVGVGESAEDQGTHVLNYSFLACRCADVRVYTCHACDGWVLPRLCVRLPVPLGPAQSWAQPRRWKGGPHAARTWHAGSKALHTCTSWHVCAAMYDSSSSCLMMQLAIPPPLSLTETASLVALTRAVLAHVVRNHKTWLLRHECTGHQVTPPISTSKREEGMKVGGRIVISLKSRPQPQITNVIFVDHQKMEPPNSTVPKVAETKQPIKILHTVGAGLRSEAGRGIATVPPPKPHP